jgi:tRNA-2-methylthio-N6-dimethylallyladenosine synthase
MEAMAELPKVCEHLHLPVQAGSSKVLRLMNRKYDRDEYLEKVYKIREMIPDIALTTDVIVGFPGETEEDFEGTLSMLEEVRYDGIYSFKFSPRPMTRAAELRDSVSETLKSERLRRVQTLQDRITASILEACVGSVEEVLVEGPSPRGTDQLTGRTRTHRIVHFEGDESTCKGKLVPIEIRRGLKHSLYGRIVRQEDEV